jgi:hypothetical protein
MLAAGLTSWTRQIAPGWFKVTLTERDVDAVPRAIAALTAHGALYAERDDVGVPQTAPNDPWFPGNGGTTYQCTRTSVQGQLCWQWWNTNCTNNNGQSITQWTMQNTGGPQPCSGAAPLTPDGGVGLDNNFNGAWPTTYNLTPRVIADIDTGVDWNTNSDIYSNLNSTLAYNAVCADGICSGGVCYTGYDLSHPLPQCGSCTDGQACNGAWGTSSTQDTTFHGTATAGVLGAVTNNNLAMAGSYSGSAANTIVPYVACTTAGCASSDVVQSLSQIVANAGGASPVNWGAINIPICWTHPSAAMQSELAIVGAYNLLVAVSASNTAECGYAKNPMGNVYTGNLDQYDPNTGLGAAVFPGGYSLGGYMTVGGYGFGGNYVTSSSMYGPNTVELAAPSVSVLTTTPTNVTDSMCGALGEQEAGGGAGCSGNTPCECLVASDSGLSPCDAAAAIGQCVPPAIAPDHDWLWGTSFSAPAVAAAGAILEPLVPHASGVTPPYGAVARALLMDNATARPGSSGYYASWGTQRTIDNNHAILNTGAAVGAVSSLSSETYLVNYQSYWRTVDYYNTPAPYMPPTMPLPSGYAMAQGACVGGPCSVPTTATFYLHVYNAGGVNAGTSFTNGVRTTIYTGSKIPYTADCNGAGTASKIGFGYPGYIDWGRINAGNQAGAGEKNIQLNISDDESGGCSNPIAQGKAASFVTQLIQISINDGNSPAVTRTRNEHITMCIGLPPGAYKVGGGTDAAQCCSGALDGSGNCL